MKPNGLIKMLLLLYISLWMIGCTRKAENIEFLNTGKIIDASNSTIEKDTVWKDLFGGDTIDYYVSSLVRVKNARLVIKPGVRISFEDSTCGIRVEGNGVLKAVGTADKRIVFTSRKADYGSWLGLVFASGNPENAVSFAVIEYAGSKADEGYCDQPAAIGMAKNVNAKATITDCKITSTSSYGLWVAASGDINLTFKRDTLDVSAPAAVTADNMSRIDSTNHIPYMYSYIEIYGTAAEIKNTDTIQNPGVPFRIKGKVNVTGVLVILPGCTFEFEENGEIITSDIAGTSHTGTIKAIGTSQKPIVFKNKPSVPAIHWVGITLTSNNENTFRYCNISYAGGASASLNPAGGKGNFVVGRTGTGAKATIMYCSIANSGGWGIAKQPASTLTTKAYNFFTHTWVETNTFSQNTLGTIGDY